MISLLYRVACAVKRWFWPRGVETKQAEYEHEIPDASDDGIQRAPDGRAYRW